MYVNMRLPCVYVPLKYEVFRRGFEGEVQGARRLDEVENTFELARHDYHEPGLVNSLQSRQLRL